MYSYESNNDYYVNSAQSSLLDNILYEICYIGNNTYGTNLTSSYDDFSISLSSYCSSFGYICNFTYELLPTVSPNATFYDYEDLNLTFNYKSKYYNYFNQINCTADYGSIPIPLYLEIISPENKIYNTTSIILNISVEGDNIDRIWYNWEGEDVIYTDPINITFPNGQHTLTAWVNNSFGDLVSTSVTFNIQAPVEKGFRVYHNKFDWLTGETSLSQPI
jgi:hypothetical protein